MLPSLRKQFDLCSRVQRVLGISFAVVLLGFYFFGFLPDRSRLAKLQTDIATRQRELRSAQEKTRDLPSIASEVRSLRQQLERWKTLPKSQDFDQFILDMGQLSRQAALKNFNYKTGTASWNDQYWELPIAISYEGDFVNAYAFMRNVEDMRRQMRVKNMSVRSKDVARDSRDSRENKTGQVQIQVTMNLYFSDQ